MIFLGSELTAAERDLASSRLEVIPVPLERTVSYGAGTAAGPDAILAASHELERFWRGAEPCTAGIATGRAVACDGPLPEVMASVAARTSAAAAAGRLPVVLGGEHSITFGAVLGVAEATSVPVGILQVDAHADLRPAYQGEPHSHASVMHLLAERGHPIAQYGVRALCREEAEARSFYDVHHVDAEALLGVSHVRLPDDFPEAVYVSFDVDGLDPAVVPATGTPVPGGLGFWQALSIVRSALAGGRRVVGLDVVELAPRPEHPAADFTVAQLTYALMAIALGERE